MLVTQHVFIDTSAFDQNSHNYASTHFQRLSELVTQGKIKIYITSITQREVESHIREEIEQAQTKINTVLNRHRFLKNSDHPSVDAVFKGMNVEDVANSLIQKFRDWISEMSVSMIPIEEISINDILEKYFENKPPFGIRERKKCEFPDAFVLAALERWCNEHSTRMYIISGDDGMCSACKASQTLKSVKSLPEFLDLLIQGERLAEIANRLFEDNQDSILEYLQDNAYATWQWPFRPHERIAHSYVGPINISQKYLIEVEDGKAIFDVLVQVTHTAVVQRFLPPIMNMPARMHKKRIWGHQVLKAEVCLRFDAESKGKIEYINIKDETVPFHPEFSDYSDYLDTLPEDNDFLLF